MTLINQFIKGPVLQLAGYQILVPKLCLGTPLHPKLCLGDPKIWISVLLTLLFIKQNRS